MHSIWERTLHMNIFFEETSSFEKQVRKTKRYFLSVWNFQKQECKFVHKNIVFYQVIYIITWSMTEAHPECISVETNDTSVQDEFFNCSVISYGNLEPNITCGEGASNVTVSAARINGSRMQTITVTASQARTCRVCFLPSSEDEEPQRCVFNSTFAGIPTPPMAEEGTILFIYICRNSRDVNTWHSC